MCEAYVVVIINNNDAGIVRFLLVTILFVVSLYLRNHDGSIIRCVVIIA
jgi:hypothetical protein